jgi:predicted nucleic acid-binding protein
MRAVIDTSYFIEFLSTPLETRFLWILDAELVTVSLFSYEVHNVSLKGLKTNPTDLDRFSNILEKLSIEYIDIYNQEKDIYLLASEQSLSFYDASYLWAASSNKLSLATCDKQLLKTAEILKIPTIV